MLRRFLTPRWWGLHALLVAALLLCYRFGVWQWGKGRRTSGSWVNLAYGVQWWVFAGFAVFLYVKLVLDELDPTPQEERDARSAPPLPPVVQRQAPAPDEDEDDELAAYNRYLRSLHERSAGDAADPGTAGRDRDAAR